MEWDPEYRRDEVAIDITQRGMNALEGWQFVIDEQEADADDDERFEP